MEAIDIYKNVTVVVFAKNEEFTIGKILDKLLHSFSATKIVVIIAQDICDKTIDIVREKNIRTIVDLGEGKGSAIRLAIEEVVDDILVFIDADGSHKPEDILKLIHIMEEKSADLVIASRFLAGSDELSGSITNRLRFLGNILSTFTINVIWGRGKRIITDSQNGFRAIRRKVATTLRLKEKGFAIEQEMVIECLKRGYKICEVGSYELQRKHGVSHVNIIKRLPEYLWCFIKAIFYR